MWSRNRQKNRQKPTKNRQSCRFRKICLSVFVGSETDKTKPTKTVKNRQKPLSIYNPGPKPNGVSPAGQETFDLLRTSPQLINQSQERGFRFFSCFNFVTMFGFATQMSTTQVFEESSEPN